MSVTDKRVRALVDADRAIATEADNATLRLMEHRWNAVREIGSARRYADALGITHRAVDRYVAAWGLWQEGGYGTVPTRTPNDVLELARMTVDRRTATEAVADAKGLGIQQTRKTQRPAVDRVLNVMREEPDESKRADKAKRYAERVETAAKSKADDEAARTVNVERAILTIETKVNAAASALRLALHYAKSTDLDPDAVEILADSLDNVRRLLDLLNLKIVGDTGVDWDREVSRILGEAS